MVKDNFLTLLNNPNIIQQENTVELKSIVKKHPYFQSARILFLKTLKDQESFKYNNELKVTAAYTADRAVLFDYITSKAFTEKVNDITREENTTTQTKANKPSTIVEQVKEELHIGEPISFTENETHSFNQWLQLSSSTLKKVIPVPETENTLQKNIIDRFIAINPKISRVNKSQPIQAKPVDTQQEPVLMTETLAKIYLEQKKYDNAIKAYEILSLKYPEKSGLFADQIRKIKILQKS
ncbi:tetratricopeptide repeat protein [Tenacibaculum amylolyticum]|uniref:tetratricopeptide repeat protein n=1 Tax=Tenacibaculum amylolyticum TaxID=104269 RepID=UPI00389490DE